MGMTQAPVNVLSAQVVSRRPSTGAGLTDSEDTDSLAVQARLAVTGRGLPKSLGPPCSGHSPGRPQCGPQEVGHSHCSLEMVRSRAERHL